MEFIMENWKAIAGIASAVLFVASEVIALNPKWKSNSVAQAISKLAILSKLFTKNK